MSWIDDIERGVNLIENIVGALFAVMLGVALLPVIVVVCTPAWVIGRLARAFDNLMR